MSEGFKNETKQSFVNITAHRHKPECHCCCRCCFYHCVCVCVCVYVCTWGCWAGSPVWRWAPPCWSDPNWGGWSGSDHCAGLCPLKRDRPVERGDFWLLTKLHVNRDYTLTCRHVISKFVCTYVCVCVFVTWQKGQFLLEDGEDGGRFHVNVGHL